MADYYTFVAKIDRLLGIDLSLYKEAQMRRRLTSLRNKRGFSDFDAYYIALTKNRELLNEFTDRMTINVSEFYRNPKRWNILREKVIPKLLKQKYKNTLQIWSAACSTGEEPYSLAMMLREYFPNTQATILATDIDESALALAQNGVYQPQALKELSDQQRSTYFTFKNEKYYIDENMKQQVTFKKHDLLKDHYPINMDLIVCRNVLIYFTDEAKDSIYERFSNSLVKNGVLFVGSTEQIFHPNHYGLTLFDTFFYEKI